MSEPKTRVLFVDDEELLLDGRADCCGHIATSGIWSS